jgi:hypothetical protein
MEEHQIISALFLTLNQVRCALTSFIVYLGDNKDLTEVTSGITWIKNNDINYASDSTISIETSISSAILLNSPDRQTENNSPNIEKDVNCSKSPEKPKKEEPKEESKEEVALTFQSTQSITTSAQVIVGVGAVSSATIAASSSSSSPTSLWSIMNQLQLLILFLLIKSYVSEDIRHYLLGQKYVMTNINIFSSNRESKSMLDFFGEKQTDKDLRDIGLKSESAFVNTFTIFSIFAVLGILHVILHHIHNKKMRWSENYCTRIYI